MFTYMFIYMFIFMFMDVWLLDVLKCSEIF